jgi:hypothetical protein
MAISWETAMDQLNSVSIVPTKSEEGQLIAAANFSATGTVDIVSIVLGGCFTVAHRTAGTKAQSYEEETQHDVRTNHKFPPEGALLERGPFKV